MDFLRFCGEGCSFGCSAKGTKALPERKTYGLPLRYLLSLYDTLFYVFTFKLLKICAYISLSLWVDVKFKFMRGEKHVRQSLPCVRGGGTANAVTEGLYQTKSFANTIPQSASLTAPFTQGSLSLRSFPHLCLPTAKLEFI